MRFLKKCTLFYVFPKRKDGSTKEPSENQTILFIFFEFYTQIHRFALC